MVKCLVCGNRSSGVHYGVESCEGCKAFYKRGVLKAVEYKCYFGQKCVIEGSSVYRCKACRFQKCIALGMNHRAPKRRRRVQEKPVSPKFLYEDSRQPENSTIYFDGKFRQTALVPTSPNRSPDSSVPHAVSVIRFKPAMKLTDLNDELLRKGRVSLGSLITFQTEDIDGGFSQSTRNGTRPNAFEPHVPDKLDEYKFNGLPKFLKDYWSVIRQRGFLINNTINNVVDARNKAFGHLFSLWDSYMIDVQHKGNKRSRADIPLEEMVGHVQKGFEGFIRIGCSFLLLLPGFTDLDTADQSVLLVEKFTETWLLTHAPYIKDGEWTIILGPNRDIHFSEYWLRRIFEPDTCQILFSFAAELNSIHLTHVEHFLLLAVATFQPEYTTAKNKTFLTFLHAHYLDCLLRSIRSRLNREEQAITERKLQNFMRHFRSLYRLGNFYVRLMNYEKAPFRAVQGSTVITVEEALCKEDDGLEPVIDESISPMLLI